MWLRGLGDGDPLAQFGKEWSLIPADTRAKILAVANTSSPSSFVASIAGGSLGFEPPGGSSNQWGPTGYIMRDETMQQFVGDSRYAGIQDKFEPLYVFNEQNSESALLEWQIKPQYAGAWDFLKNNGYVQLSPNPTNGSIAQYNGGYGIQDYSQVYFDPKFGLYTPLANIRIEPSQSSFFDTFGPWILLLGPLLYAASTVIAAQAAAASAAGSGAAAGATSGAATTAGEIASGISTEAFTAGEEALREIGLAESLGATITPYEAAGWQAALTNAGLAVPESITSVLQYQSIPNPPSGTSDVVKSLTQGGESAPTEISTAPTATPYEAPPSPGSITTSSGASLPDASQLKTFLNTGQQIYKAGALLTAAAGASTPRTSTQSPFAPLVRPQSSGPSVIDRGQYSAQTNVTQKTPNLWWLLVAGAGIYAVTRKKRAHS